MTLDWLGLDAATPNELSAAYAGGLIALGGWLLSRTMFGGLHLRRREPSRRIRHRPPSRPTNPRRKKPAAPKRKRRR